MKTPETSFDRVWPLIEAACLGTISEPEMRRLQDALRGDAELQRAYLDYCRMHAELRFLCRAQATNEAVLARIAIEGEAEAVRQIDDGAALSRAVPLPPSFLGGLAAPFRGTVSFFAEHNMALSYLVAATCLAVASLIGSLVHVSHERASSLARVAPPATEIRNPIEYVGRITGMKNCRWADPQTESFAGASVPLGRRYALASGLMEITYHSGAKVILEGPCTYELESSAGGFLALGKLTARVESENQSSKTQDLRPKTQDPSPKTETSKSPNLHISKSLFTVRTPTAVVTDLGTEFGVEVAANGDTTSHVFQGRVAMRAEGPDASDSRGPAASAAGNAGQIILAPGQSARVEKDARTGDTRITTGDKAGAAPKFVRQLYEPPKQLDLLDIVAGGVGTGVGRGKGVDPVTGTRCAAFSSEWRRSDRLYGPVRWHEMIDGVFVPDGREPEVQLDSAGHCFAEFPKSLGATFSLIWARGAEVAPAERGTGWIFEIDRCRQFMPRQRGIMAFHACSGITFDLGAMRKRFPGVHPARFQAVVGLADPRPFSASADGSADFWVFVDGRLKLKRAGLRQQDSPIEAAAELGPEDRFLTLVSTDGGDEIRDDCVVLGDPVLQMAKNESANRKEGQRKQP